VKALNELKLLIFLNPNAGSDSRAHFDRVSRFINYTNFSFDLVETTHRGHCKEYLQNGIEGYLGVLIISGDGLMHEFANSAVCGKVAVSHVPAGSGNAFAKTQSWLAGEDCTDEIAVFLAVKGRKREFTLMVKD
jgi:diacylglycerol kinase family enzyme